MRKSFQEWLDELNRNSPHPTVISDYDLQSSLHDTPITEQEFQRRLIHCSFNIKP